MRAAIFREFRQPFSIEDVADPRPSDTGVVLKVEACGICRSDWHGWMGNDADIQLPHIPGHELSGQSRSLVIVRANRDLLLEGRYFLEHFYLFGHKLIGF